MQTVLRFRAGATEADRENRSRPITIWATVWASLVKELQIARRYLPNLLGKIAHLVVRVLFFLLLSNLITVDGQSLVGRNMAGRDLFIFFQAALLLWVFNDIALRAPISVVTTDLYNGTLEYLYTNPISRYAYYVGTILAEAVIAQVIFLPLFLTLFLFARSGVGNMLMVLLVCLTMLVTLIAFGVMLAVLGLLWRQVGAITNVLGSLFELIAGAFSPVAAFPLPIQFLAYILPYTWGYDLVRYYSFDGEWRTLLPVWLEWSILIAFALFYTLLSRYLLRKVERHAKQSGLHII